MSWMSQLYQTYENNIGKTQQDAITLTPLAHMEANAQIEVILDEDGNFCGAGKIDKANAVTLIPVTEASAGRSSGVAPHMLSDTLSYIAGDFKKYCQDEKSVKNAEEKFQRYIMQLNAWHESAYTHPKVEAVYKYLNKQILISDLIKTGIVTLTEDGFFDNRKISGQTYEKSLVRFRVLSMGEAQEESTWEDSTLIEAYTNYFLSEQNGKEDVCYLTGKMQPRTENHPKGIIAANYGAKLVSANDNQGYTYRGRFQNSEQAYVLSYEASQKVHSALTWLAKKQGVYVGTKDKRTFICWNPQGRKTPNILDPLGLIDEEEESGNPDIPYRKKLLKTLQGYRDQFDDTDGVVVMGLDAATTGRLSITYYNELLASDFLERIQCWGETCNWYYLKFTEQKIPYYRIKTPAFRRIAECAFGREKGNFIEANDKVLKEQVQRLVKCMLEQQPVPKDIVYALTVRASTPLAYSRGNRERVLSTACAVIAKYYRDKGIWEKGENDEMKLDLENRDRSYLFGRVLAVLEKVERAAYDRGESREPNAIRLQSAYVNHPLKTWMILEDVLRPYYQKLKPGSREYYKNLIGEITGLFEDDDQSVLNQGLKETYLLGYYLQRAELNKKKDDQKEEIVNE